MEKEKLQEILRLHKMWRNDEVGGVRANLRDADLREADLSNIKTDYLTIGINIECPEEGSFIAYKKSKGHLIKLLILEDAKRNSATTKKCRCNKAKVLEIINIETENAIDKIESEYDSLFIYEVGKTVKVKNFEENRWDECSSGIHFFMNKQNALDWEN